MKVLFYVTASLLFFSCNGINSIKQNLTGLRPYEQYLKNLEKAELLDRPMVKKWVAAGKSAMTDSVSVTLPYAETGHFVSHRPEARSYQFDARDGQVVTVGGSLSVTSDARVFTDLFIWKENEWKAVAWADSSLTLSYEFSRDSQCLLRIQPELLVNASYSLSVSVTPVLINPVSGASNRSIQSFWGDSRDGGKRRHEGVDIFAKKGTPIVAPTDGTISRVGNSRLGGKVIWMYDQKRSHSYYFAHLDSQYAVPGQRVSQGDVIGTVGNTGNARFTPSHLHFGIYQAGAKDPLHYIKTFDMVVNVSPLDTTFAATAFKVSSKKASLQRKLGFDPGGNETLPLETFIRVIGQTQDHYRVALADEKQGFILKSHVSPAQTGTPKVLRPGTALLVGLPSDSTTVWLPEHNTKVDALARHNELTLVRTTEGIEGWVRDL